MWGASMPGRNCIGSGAQLPADVVRGCNSVLLKGKVQSSRQRGMEGRWGGPGSNCLLNHLPFYLKGRVSQILLTARYLIQGLSNQRILGNSVKRLLNRVFFSRIWQSHEKAHVSFRSSP